jgi:hypothetical protein
MASGIRGGNLYISEDNVVFWGDPDTFLEGLYDRVTKSYVNDATLTFTLKNSAGSAVSGASAVSMTYVSGTNGCYQGVLEDGVSLTEGSTYYLEITATASSDRIGFRRLTYQAKYHGAD